MARGSPSRRGRLADHGKEEVREWESYGDLLMTTALDAASGPDPVVLHFALPLAAAGMSVQDNWRTLGCAALDRTMSFSRTFT